MAFLQADTALGFLDVAKVMAIVGFAGGLGGLSAGFNYRHKNPLILPFSGKEVVTGFLGDVLIGIVSALASILILSLADYDLGRTLTDIKTLLKFSAVCIVAGFAGLRLMRTMSRALLEKFGEQVESVGREVDNLKRVSAMLIEAAYMRVNKKYREEAEFCTQALKLDPKNEEALIGLAVANSMIDEPDNYPAALDNLTHVVEHINKDSARAYYNIACIGNLMRSKYATRFAQHAHAQKDVVLKNLAAAISRSAAYRTYAADDADFADLRSDPDFKKLLQ